MSAGRDWLKTLYPASFKGVPFQTERDGEIGGRRIVSHEFPYRDDPFNEDLGEKKRDFEITAYVASDAADSEAAALVAVCTQRGSGVLVLPSHGPLQVRCLEIKRDREKDQAGKIALSATFVREGAATALISVSSLTNMVFVAADALLAAVPAFAKSAIISLGQPDFVISAATSAIQEGAAILEAVRTGENVDPVVSGTQRVKIEEIYDAAPAAVDAEDGVNGDSVANLVEVSRALADGMPANTAIAAFETIIGQTTLDPQSTYLTKASKTADENKLAVYLVMRLAAALAYSEALARADIPDRQAAITLRANAAEYFEAILGSLPSADAAVYVPLVTLRGAVIEYLSRAILDRAPVVSVEANKRMPSLWWAHRLYQDPGRSTDLVRRNRVAHPSFMPVEFEALSR